MSQWQAMLASIVIEAVVAAALITALAWGHAARAAALEDLLAAAKTTGTPAVAAKSVGEALELAEESADGGAIVVSGSVYLVGEVRTLLLGAEGAQA